MYYPCPEYTSAALMLNALEGGGVEWDCEFAQNQKIPDASATDALGQVPTSFTMFKITLVGINLPPCQWIKVCLKETKQMIKKNKLSFMLRHF